MNDILLQNIATLSHLVFMVISPSGTEVSLKIVQSIITAIENNFVSDGSNSPYTEPWSQCDAFITSFLMRYHCHLYAYTCV